MVKPIRTRPAVTTFAVQPAKPVDSPSIMASPQHHGGAHLSLVIVAQLPQLERRRLALRHNLQRQGVRALCRVGRSERERVAGSEVVEEHASDHDVLAQVVDLLGDAALLLHHLDHVGRQDAHLAV
eukprot:scaffold122227_cov63-Phaeocystis_antarctica.AAC.2